MKKRLISIALASVMALSLAGCGVSAGGTTTRQTHLRLLIQQPRHLQKIPRQLMIHPQRPQKPQQMPAVH